MTEWEGKRLPPNTLLWPLEPHTEGKHRVLRHYLDAWLPIMLSSNDAVLVIDAFAGPGRYEKGEDGSPLIALDAYLSHRNILGKSGRINFFFIEKDGDRATNLEQLLSWRRGELPEKCSYRVINGSFTEQMSSALDAIETHNKTLAPAFVMLDPFGVSDTPMAVIARILNNPKSEVYISFMSRDINRFNTVPEYEVALNGLFGTEDWKDGLSIENGPKKIEFFYELYETQLKASGAEFVLRFDLYEKESLVYALFFATKNDVGCDKMKQAMWKVAPFGDFQFKSASKDQMILGPSVVDFSALDQELILEFGKNQPVSVKSLESFLRTDRTAFHTGHLKTRLSKMAQDVTLVVDENTRNRRGSFPLTTVVRFVDPPPPAPTQTSFI